MFLSEISLIFEPIPTLKSIFASDTITKDRWCAGRAQITGNLYPAGTTSVAGQTFLLIVVRPRRKSIIMTPVSLLIKSSKWLWSSLRTYVSYINWPRILRTRDPAFQEDVAPDKRIFGLCFAGSSLGRRHENIHLRDRRAVAKSRLDLYTVPKSWQT